MLELDEKFFNVALHTHATSPVHVVHLDVDSCKLVACHVALHSVVFFEEMQEVVEMLQADILHAKVIHQEAKLYWPPFVPPQSWNGG